MKEQQFELTFDDIDLIVAKQDSRLSTNTKNLHPLFARASSAVYSFNLSRFLNKRAI